MENRQHEADSPESGRAIKIKILIEGTVVFISAFHGNMSFDSTPKRNAPVSPVTGQPTRRSDDRQTVPAHPDSAGTSTGLYQTNDEGLR